MIIFVAHFSLWRGATDAGEVFTVFPKTYLKEKFFVISMVSFCCHKGEVTIFPILLIFLSPSVSTAAYFYDSKGGFYIIPYFFQSFSF